MHGAGTHGVVLGEEEGGGGGEDGELEDAHEEGAVDRAGSPSVSPGSDEHEEGVEADKTEEGAHEGGEEGHLGASLLAVDVTVVNHGDEGIEIVLVDVLVVVVNNTAATEAVCRLLTTNVCDYFLAVKIDRSSGGALDTASSTAAAVHRDV